LALIHVAVLNDLKHIINLHELVGQRETAKWINPCWNQQLLIFAPFDPHFRLALSHAVALKA
jgi:hypothetical protein